MTPLTPPPAEPLTAYTKPFMLSTTGGSTIPPYVLLATPSPTVIDLIVPVCDIEYSFPSAHPTNTFVDVESSTAPVSAPLHTVSAPPVPHVVSRLGAGLVPPVQSGLFDTQKTS